MSDRISVIIPFRDGDVVRLGATLGTVLRQTHLPAEIIVVDDGSSPATLKRLSAVLSDQPARLVLQSHMGPGGARNRGAAEARGTWIAFLDADDLWRPEKLERQLALAQSPAGQNRLILCASETVDEKGDTLSEQHFDQPIEANSLITRMLERAGPVHSFTSTLFLERSAFLKLGGFDTRLRFREDHHLLIRAARSMGCAAVPEILSARVMHRASYTSLRRNAPARDLLARQERFAQAIASIEHGFDPERFLAREALSIGKRKIAEGSTREALAMASAALTRDPSQMRAWMLGPAALAARAVPRLAARWRRSA